MSNSNPIQAQAILQTALVDTSSGVIIRQWYGFFAQLQALISSNYQPVFDVTQYGSTGNGSTADDIGVNGAIRAAVNQGGGTIYFPPVSAFYNITSPIAINTSIQGYNGQPITFLGVGAASMIKRGANMPTGQGMFDLAGAQNVIFSNLLIDGNVTESVGVTYSQLAALNYDPMTPLLATNSSFWIHDGSANIQFLDVVIQHTGGYAIAAQAVEENIENLFFFKLLLLNNRPNLFGINPGDLNYGSWTGGILLHANGLTSTATVNNAKFLSCRAERCTGTAFWAGHLYGFSTSFAGVVFEDISALDCGRDVIQLGAAHGAVVNNVSARRIGYITTDDTSPSVARWESGQWAVCVDCGPSFGVAIGNVSVTSINGGALDLDGMAYCTVNNFNARIPLPGEPEYIEDGIGNVGWGGSTVAGGTNAVYGVNLSPAGYGPYMEGGHRLSGCSFVNFSNSAIRMFGSNNSSVSGCNIWHPAVATGPPVIIGNLSSTELSTGNTITNNKFQYAPSSSMPCVLESGLFFTSSVENFVLGNQIVQPSNAVEFTKDSGSSSVGSITGTISGTFQVTNGFVT